MIIFSKVRLSVKKIIFFTSYKPKSFLSKLPSLLFTYISE
nr:MAG TPA: hypothetical protein [Caudoviricetes sp.]